MDEFIQTYMRLMISRTSNVGTPKADIFIVFAGVGVGAERTEVQGGLTPGALHVGVVNGSDSGSKLAGSKHPDI